MKDDNNGIKDLIDTVENAVEFVKENQEMVEGLVPSDDKLTIDETSPLKSATADEDMVYITIETKSGSVDSIEVEGTDNGVAVGINGEVVNADVPEDAVVDDVEAELNNGVLEVRIPREGGD